VPITFCSFRWYQVVVDAKSNEFAVVMNLPQMLDIKDSLVTSDAL